MDRLTFEGNFCDIAQCTAIPCKCSNNCSQRQVWERLKDYEDAGLTPVEVDFVNEAAQQLERLCKLCDLDRLGELVEADNDGRVIVLPCKIGDTVYRIQYIIERHGDKGCVRLGVDALQFQLIWLSEWGKTIFATREEAEQALEEGKGNSDVS